MRKAKWKRRGKGIAGFVFLLFLADYALYPSLAMPEGSSHNSGNGALWVRYKWYFGENNDKIPELASRAKRHGISDLYFHVRNIQVDGSLKYRYLQQAQTLNRRLKEIAPRLRRFAWIYAGNPSGRGEVDISKPSVRRRMVTEAKWLVEKAGFSGIQWDYEICPDGDPNLPLLLEETRAALPRSIPVSVAVPAWLPWPFGGYGWSPHYYQEIAKVCDQVAVMSYDTGAYFPRTYAWLVAKQVDVVYKAVVQANDRCQVIVGLPTYEDGTFSHNPHAETVKLGLIGLRAGIRNLDEKWGYPNVGIFADYTTDEDEWRTFDELWPIAVMD